MPKNNIIQVVNGLITRRLHSLALTDVVAATIVSIDPIKIQTVAGAEALDIPDFLIDVDSIPKNAKVGDTFDFLRYNNGSRFKCLPNRVGGEGGITDYEELDNLPRINSIILKGNRKLAETPLTNLQIDAIMM